MLLTKFRFQAFFVKRNENELNRKYRPAQDVLSCEVKPILLSDEEKELVWRHREEQRKLDVKKISETFVKNAFYLLWIRLL